MTASGYVENTIIEDVIWNLGDLYSSTSDPQIQTDTEWLREQVLSFASYRGKVAGLGPEDLLEAIRRFEEINERTQKLLAYHI